MEVLINSITYNKVPVTWSKLAYPSKRGLASWLENMWKRLE
jgi:dynein heavy chain